MKMSKMQLYAENIGTQIFLRASPGVLVLPIALSVDEARQLSQQLLTAVAANLAATGFASRKATT
jgi:hypothetical protein